MSTIGNMPGADIRVPFPSGEVRTVNMIVLLAQTQHAECMARFGHGIARNGPTIRALRAQYELDWYYDSPVRTWAACAETMRYLHTSFTSAIADARKDAA